MPKKSTKELPPIPVKAAEIFLPIYFRITVDGERTEFSTGQSIVLENWNQAKGRVRGTSERARIINENLDGFLNRAKKAQQDLSDKGKPITATSLRNQMLGIGDDFHQIVECFENFVKEIKLKVGSDYKVGTLKNYNVTLGHLKEFIASNYFAKDIPLKDLNYKFITDFELMCKTKWECVKSSTTTKHIQRIRKVIGIAIANEWLDKDPFHLYSGKHEKGTVKFLTGEELKAIEGKVFFMERLERVRDMFIFSCYTGYAYSDVQKFSANDIVTGMDGLKWIYTGRAKNESKSNVPLLPKALEIIEKYKSHPDVINKNRLLPVISNIKTNAYLKEIADLCGVRKNLTFHMARHTFATTVTLTNGVPIETVSAMLGHASLRTTQIYAKVIENKVSADMLALREKLKPLGNTLPKVDDAR
jgi:site-specific recombinase XerD